jgi:DedD protein
VRLDNAPNLTDGLHFYRMSLFSFLRKNKQEPASDDSAFYSHAEEDSKAVRSRSRRDGKSEPVDSALPEKKRARRRLIGAVALVLAAIVGLPMILDSEPQPLTDDIAIQIPSKDKLGIAAPAPIPASSSLDRKEEMVEPAPAARQEPAKPAAPEKAVTAPATVKPEAKPADKAVDKTDDGARAKVLLEGKTDPKASDKTPGKFVIQVAALANKEKVDELQNKLKGAGIKSYTQKIATDSGERTRIRVGPFASKEEAEKVRAKMVKLGLNGTLVPA